MGTYYVRGRNCQRFWVQHKHGRGDCFVMDQIINYSPKGKMLSLGASYYFLTGSGVQLINKLENQKDTNNIIG